MSMETVNKKLERRYIPPIEIVIWEPVPDKPGYVRKAGMRTIGEIFKELSQRLKENNLWPDEYFQVTTDWDYDIPFPEFHWISCFAVTGGSEGHYIHIEIINDDRRKLIYLGKTLFQGMDFAYDVARACAKHLGA